MKFRHSCIIVKNFEESIKFYTELFGFRVAKQLTLEGEYPETAFRLLEDVKLTYVKLLDSTQKDDDIPILELHYWEKPNFKKHFSMSHIAITVDDIEKEYEKLIKAGVKFLSKPIQATDSNSKVCFCLDNSLNFIELVED